jgi:hypothetical protein
MRDKISAPQADLAVVITKGDSTKQVGNGLAPLPANSNVPPVWLSVGRKADTNGQST